MDATGTTHDAARSPRDRALLTVAGVAAGVLLLGGAGAVVLDRASVAAHPAGGPSSQPATPLDAGLTPGASSAPDATDASLTAPLPPGRPVLVLGDSLALDVYPWLADLLPDRPVTYVAAVGRSTPATEQALDELDSIPPVVIVSSGTNDPVANVVEESARRILDRLGPDRCVVWVDVVRPDSFGEPAERINAALDRATQGRPQVRILHWSALAAAHPEWFGPDGIHPDTAGARARAEAFAAAARACSAFDPTAPRATKEYLPPSAFRLPGSGQGGGQPGGVSGGGVSGGGVSGGGVSGGGVSSTRPPSGTGSTTGTTVTVASSSSEARSVAPVTSSPTTSVASSPPSTAAPSAGSSAPAGGGTPAPTS